MWRGGKGSADGQGSEGGRLGDGGAERPTAEEPTVEEPMTVLGGFRATMREAYKERQSFHLGEMQRHEALDIGRMSFEELRLHL